jgi:hypothetical protein
MSGAIPPLPNTFTLVEGVDVCKVMSSQNVALASVGPTNKIPLVNSV